MSKKICLVDGSGYIFRAFYGLPPMTAPDGTPVNAVYGFTNMIMKLTAKIDCDYNLVLFDAKRQNFRNDIFPEYKANRAEPPADLIPQFSIIRQTVDVLNLNHLEIEGYEADDLIATYANQALSSGMEVVIVSADKDLMQLIKEGVTFYDPMKDKFITAEDAKEKFGVYPEKIPDVQALSGDSIDNIPGVPGIGPKTAAELINTYGSLEQVISHASEIKQNKRRETLLANIDNAKISLQLVTLKADVPVAHPVDYYTFHCPDMATIENFITKYAFNSLRNRLLNWAEDQCLKTGKSPKNEKAKIYSFKTIDNQQELQKWLKQNLRQSIAIKTLSSGNNPIFDKPLGIALAADECNAIFIPLQNQTPSADLFNMDNKKQITFEEISSCLLPILNSSNILKIGHNIKLDMHFLNIICNNQAKFLPYDDTEIMSYVLDSNFHGHGISELSELFLDRKLQNFDSVFGSGKQKAINDISLASTYMCEQVSAIYQLHHIFRPRLLAEHMVTIYEHYDRPLAQTLYYMEKNGVMVNAAQLTSLDEEFSRELQKLETEIYSLAGEKFNIASPKQIGEILYTKLNLSGKKNSSGGFQTGADILEQMAEEHPLPAKILEWRALSKLKSTYTQALLQQLDRNQRIHTTYGQTNVNTGRLSSNSPNLQNIPIRSENGKKIRRCFVAPKGYKLISADYSQVELRLLAVLADVKALKEAFKQGIDIHSATAMHVFGLNKEQITPEIRRHAKAINFGIVYGISQYGLAKQIDVTPQEAKNYIDAYFAKMPEIKTFMNKTIEFAHQNGFVVTPFGRKCSVFGINDPNKRISSFAERAAMNAPLQGGAADIMKRAMNNMHKNLIDGNFKSRILLQVHDEMVIEAPEDEVEKVSILLKETMENAVNYDVKFVAEVGIGQNWAEAH